MIRSLHFKMLSHDQFLIKLGLWDLHAREFQGFLNKDGLIEISQIEFSGSSNSPSAKRVNVHCL